MFKCMLDTYICIHYTWHAYVFIYTYVYWHVHTYISFFCIVVVGNQSDFSDASFKKFVASVLLIFWFHLFTTLFHPMLLVFSDMFTSWNPWFWQWKSLFAMNVCMLFLVLWRWKCLEYELHFGLGGPSLNVSTNGNAHKAWGSEAHMTWNYDWSCLVLIMCMII